MGYYLRLATGLHFFSAAGLESSLTSLGFWRWVFEQLGNVLACEGLAFLVKSYLSTIIFFESIELPLTVFWIVLFSSLSH
ncbi:MAG: hypothetical protein DRI89_11355 [Bacteroidetes bacterium]|nr:MAG: hypothetical protein DRI89_11355 [Bacteroidota bacterium]